MFYEEKVVDGVILCRTSPDGEFKKKRTGADFVEWLQQLTNSKNDAGVSRALQMAPPVISKFRHERTNVSPETILRIHDYTGAPIADIRAAAGLVPFNHPSESEAPASV